MSDQRPIGPTTRVLGVIGDPVEHSRSPAMHNAAFAALDLDWVYVAFPVPRGSGAAAVRAMRELGLAGLNVTMPHKTDAAEGCDSLAPDASALGSVNTVLVRDNGRLVGESTDGEGFLRALDDEGVSVDGRQVLVLGAGGAARAIARAVGAAGGNLTVSARRLEVALAVAKLTAGGRAVELAELTVKPFDVIVNATPVGMNGERPFIDTDALHTGQFVYDTVYPGDTPLVAAALAAGAGAANGLGMLVHQGAMAFELFTGQKPPLDVMRAAAAS